jgi:hypothetical protein
MSIARNAHRDLVAECSTCGVTTESDIDGVRDWSEFMRELKELGWRVRRDDAADEWIHECPDCANA